MPRQTIFVTGATGYLGRALVPRLARRGHRVRALVRAGSESRLPLGCEAVLGNALDGATFRAAVPGTDTFIQLVGTPHPSPAKARQFREVDLVSVRESVAAAAAAGVSHFVYVSVAQPAPAMKAYVEVRRQGEELIRAAQRATPQLSTTGLAATILRPWYVLGPGHRWPYVLLPFYRLAERLPATRESARRLGLVRLTEMVAALAAAVEDPPAATAGEPALRLVEVPAIRAAAARER